MNITDLNIPRDHVHRLLSASNADAALLYLYLQAGNDVKSAAAQLRISESRVSCAAALLRQLGLWQPERKQVLLGERPQYSETDVLRAMDRSAEFRSLYGEIQRAMGRSLTTEELKILLGFVNYLGLPTDVISVLVCYCRERARQKGSSRNPSLRSIEKEAYAWAEMGIDTVEEASAYIGRQNRYQSDLRQLMELLQIRGRNLTAGEERYARQWMQWGFDNKVIAMAYERTCLNTGGLNWAYMNKILSRWHQQNMLTVEQISAGDRKAVPKGASGQLGEAELEAIRRAMQEV